MAPEHSDQSLLDDIEDINSIIGRFEELVEQFESRFRQSQIEYESLFKESAALVQQARKRLHDIHEQARHYGLEPLPGVDIQDNKLKSAWMVLYRFPEGATAEEVAALLNKHRTTVSTYLNTLTLMNYAAKERRGHEIYYRAVLKGAGT